MEKVKVSKVERSLYTNYLVRAEECLNAAKNSLNLNQWNSSAISAIHSGISSLDALCVYYLGQRHAGQNHEDAITLSSALCNKFSTVHKGVWGRPSPTFGGCSANEVSAEGGLAPLAEVRCNSPKLTTQRTRSIKQLKSEDADAIANRVIKILKMKNMAEYEERLVHRTEAQNILKDAERLFEAVKNKLPK